MEEEEISQEYVLDFLKSRVGILEGVCITGGEPLINNDIIPFIQKVKSLGYKVKLDTNGSFPDKLQQIIDEGLVDYVAMDIKNCHEKYPETVGRPGFDVAPILKSVQILMQGRIPYEFRTTTLKDFHTEEDFLKIGKWLEGADKYFIQPFKDSGDIISISTLEGYETSTLEHFQQILTPFFKQIAIRG
jgi:pyruvate formate lyase activating enzyme